MSNIFWLTKITALVESLDLTELRQELDEESQVYIDALARRLNESENESERVKSYVDTAKLINGSSDRSTLSLLASGEVSSHKKVKHLLSGANLTLDCRDIPLNSTNIPLAIINSNNDLEISDRELFWWLWRCLPEATGKSLGSQSALIPAVKTLPDASIWSDASLTAALAGSLAGYPRDNKQQESSPYLAIFSFSPVQELIKASRKMRDFWAGSWLLHYLSARICWYIAQKYGADSLVYPSLYQQPLIDRWLRKEYPQFKYWIKEPRTNSILTAGFPNVIVAVLPQEEVKKAMQTAHQNLLGKWAEIGKQVYQQLKKPFLPELQEDDPRWNGWLEKQWQTYWAALPIGKQDLPLVQPEINSKDFESWLDQQNQACNLQTSKKLFSKDEANFIKQVEKHFGDASVNVGSWWCYIFDQLRFSLSSVKTARHWNIPTAFKARSTVSGIGSAISLGKDDNRDNLGLFDGKEQLNATEILKRGLHLILPGFLGLEARKLAASYPDLCSGVAGWLRQNPDVRDYYVQACQKITDKFDWTKDPRNRNNPANSPWGIPWMDDEDNSILQTKYNPRLLNGGWLIDDYPDKDNEEHRKQTLKELTEEIARYFPPGNNPTDWYVLAVGDGDGLSKWLKGNNLLKYQEYLDETAIAELKLPEAVATSLNELRKVKKRMGPSTHNALSRALLDFSNQLVPYLTEQRYTGRLIYSGGDDVFAYTNLWEWDSWLWDIRECFRGAKDPLGEFEHDDSDYWKWQGDDLPPGLNDRPLFTMGREATISFGLVIAHHSVPLAIALESLWQAEEEAKEHFVRYNNQNLKKDAVQVRVMFGSGNTLQATSKFEVFNKWRELIKQVSSLNNKINTTLPAFFEQAALVWEQHPAPDEEAIEVWVRAFCTRRDIFQNEDERSHAIRVLTNYLTYLTRFTKESNRDAEIKNWLKLAAFILRKRQITIRKTAGV